MHATKTATDDDDVPGDKLHISDEKIDRLAVKGCCTWLNTLDPQRQFPGGHWTAFSTGCCNYAI